MRHDSGLHVLAAPTSPNSAESITPSHIATLIGALLEGYESVVIDAGSVLDERALTVFEAAETIVLPVYPEISALKAMHGLLDYLNEAGSIGAKATFVLNNVFARDILKLRDVEAALGTKISLDLPYDPFLYLKAVNEGVPIVLGAPALAPPPSTSSSSARPPSGRTGSWSRWPSRRGRGACSASVGAPDAQPRPCLSLRRADTRNGRPDSAHPFTGMIGAIFGSNTRPSNIRQVEHAPAPAVNVTRRPRRRASRSSGSIFWSISR